MPRRLSAEDVLTYAKDMRDRLEGCLNSAYGAETPGRKVCYIADVKPIFKYDVYGYAPEKRIFLKICAYNPASVTRMAAILNAGGCQNDERHVYEAHIPYVLQFLTDYGLAGMDYIHISDGRFRVPLPVAEKRMDVEMMFEQRQFYDGLQDLPSASEYFWPFAVARRSACDLELDVFEKDIITVGHMTSGYEFLSRSLGGLWEEERLRRGEYPKRGPRGGRNVIAGAGLTTDEERNVLREVCQTARMGDDVEDVEDVEDVNGECGSVSQALKSFEDIIRYLDASEDESGGEAEILDLADERTWAEIADCTQQEGGDERICRETVRKLDFENASQLVDSVETSSQPIGDANLSLGRQSPALERGEKRLTTDLIQSFDDDVVMSGVVSQVNEAVSTGPSDAVDEAPALGEEVTYVSGEVIDVMPRERPPSYAQIARRAGQGAAGSIRYNTPFYGNENDEIQGTEVFGGRIIPVRRAGANGYADFPRTFEVEKNIVEVLPRVICPVERPPTLRELRNSYKPKQKMQHDIGGMVIDSAGRQVQRREEAWEQPSFDEEFGPDPKALSQDVDIGKMFDDEDACSDSTERGAPSVELQRPMSPKYDEAYQITAGPDCTFVSLKVSHVFFSFCNKLTFSVQLLSNRGVEVKPRKRPPSLTACATTGTVRRRNRSQSIDIKT